MAQIELNKKKKVIIKILRGIKDVAIILLAYALVIVIEKSLCTLND